MKRWLIALMLVCAVLIGFMYGGDVGSVIAAVLGAALGLWAGWKLREHLKRKSKLYRRLLKTFGEE